MKALDGLLLVLVLAAAAVLRAPGLALPHDRGDQLIWAGVSQNVHERGTAGYTLRGLEPRYAPTGGGAAIVSFSCVEGRGPLLEQFMAEGERYWDAPMVNQPPGFFLLLLASHAVLGGANDGFPLVAKDPRAFAVARAEFVANNGEFYERRLEQIAALPEAERGPARHELEEQLLRQQGQWERDLTRRLVAAPPRDPGGVKLWRVQLWAMLPVLLADLVTVALVFGAAHALGGRWAALLAGLAWTTDPLALYCAGRLLSNAPLAAATALALALEAYAARAVTADGVPPRRRLALAAAIGAACALAITIKVSAVFLLPAIVLGRLVRRDLGWDLAVILGVALAVAAPWWALQARVLGHPFGFAWRRQADHAVVSPWGALVAGRGAGYYAGVLLRSPLVVLGAIAGAFAWRRHAAPVAFSVAVIAAAMRFEGKEARHVLLAYPPLVVAASVGLVKVLGDRKRPALAVTGGVLLGALLLWQGAYGLELALDPGRAP